MPKKRGAPTGNNNARKHGFYSLAYTQREGRELSQITVDHSQNSIKFFKVLISRVAQRIKPSASNTMSFHENVIALQTVVFAVSRILSAVNRRRKMLSSENKENEKDMIEFLERIGMTRVEIDELMFGIVPVRQKGGQPGNLNALKHGFFSTHYTPEELRQLADLDEDDLKDEIILLQVLMKRVFIGLKGSLPPLDHYKGVRILASADACLERLNRERGSLFGAQAVIDQMRESMKELAFEED